MLDRRPGSSRRRSKEVVGSKKYESRDVGVSFEWRQKVFMRVRMNGCGWGRK